MLRSMMDKGPVDPLLSNPVFSPDISPTSRGPLHPGATWKGVQRSGRNSYDVCVKFDSVDVSSGALTGTLEIKGLTPELESLVTFFEGEIIGETGPGFLTNKYGATELDDMRHWRRFPPFTRNRLEEQMIKPNLNLRGAVNRPYLFMRWKERFVVPRDLSIHGASFAGIYYACRFRSIRINASSITLTVTFAGLDCEPALDYLPISRHRGISPVPRFSPPRRRFSDTSQLSQVAQTRPRPAAPSRTSSAARPSETDTAAFQSPSTSSPRPAQPRRTSSGSVSYAAALRGTPLPAADSSPPTSLATPPGLIPLPALPPSHANTQPLAEIPTPKSEAEPSFAALSLSPPTTPPSEAPQLPPIPSLASVPLLSSPLLVTNQRGTRLPEEEWPVPSSPPQSPTSPRSMRRRSSIASQSQVLNETGRGRSGSEAGASLWVGEDETYGLRSWTDATITGFYHYRNSEPYQEISLRYVPTTQGSSQTFTFR
ncbi:hypothetical protein JCM1841_004777 [Sporobolomyces salmonicolor]